MLQILERDIPIILENVRELIKEVNNGVHLAYREITVGENFAPLEAIAHTNFKNQIEIIIGVKN